MTNLDDFDRSLSDFLADGPNTAPEAPVIAAMAHARTTPRQPDPLRAFRSDPMARRRNGLVGARPGLAVAVLAVAVGAIGVAVVGSRPPGDTNLPAPSATDSRTPAPTSTPVPTPSQLALHVDLTGQCCGTPSIDIEDQSGHLTGAVAASSDTVDNEAFTATNDDQRTVRLTWQGAPCDTVHRLTITADYELMIDRPKCGGDSMAVFRTLILTFDEPVDTPSLSRSIFAGRPDSGLPTWTASAPDSAGNGYEITLADPGSRVELLEGYFDPQVGASGAGPTGIRILQSPQTILTLVWLGPACATTPALSIDPSGDRWQLANAPCTSSTPEVLRMIGVTLTAPRQAGVAPTVEAVVAAP